MDRPSAELVDAVGGLLRADPARALAVADRLRAPGRTFESTVSGMSMWPVLPPGSRIRVALEPRNRPEVGEIVAFVARGQVVVHRVVHRGSAGAARGHVVTLGDATLVPDPPVPDTAVLGAVTGVRTAGGWAPAPGPPHRRLRARAVRSVTTAAAVFLLRLDAGVAGHFLTALHRAAGALRGGPGGSSPRSPHHPESS
jgi:hypothetical protein